MIEMSETGTSVMAPTDVVAAPDVANPSRLRLASSRAWVRDVRQGRLGHLEHDPPKPLRLRSSYRKTTFPDPSPSLTIVTPTLNHATYLPSTIHSVVSQGHPRLEYVVQDGGSTDATCDILRACGASLTSWDSSADGGQGHAINKGFAGTTGELMAYLNSDDLILPGALAYVSQYFAEHPEVDVVYGHRVLIDSLGREVGRQVLPPHEDAVLAWADYIPQETLYWRRRTWDLIGGRIDESFQFAMDWDLLLRFADVGARIHRLPRFLGAFRVHPDQKTQACWTVGEAEMFRLRSRVHGRDVEYPEINANIADYLKRHRRYQRLYRFGLLWH